MIYELKSNFHLSSVIHFCNICMPRKKQKTENTFSLCLPKFFKIFLLDMFLQYKGNNRN